MARLPVHIRLLIGLLAVALVPLSVLAAFFLLTFERALTQTVVSTVSSVADKNLEVVESYINERIHDIQLLSRLETVRRALEVPTAVGLLQESSTREDVLIDDYFEDVLLINTQGTVVWSRLQGPEVGLNIRERSNVHGPLLAGWLRAMGSLHTDITQFAPYPLVDNDLHAFIVGPVMQGSKVVGVLAARVSLKQFLPVFQDRTGLGQTGEILITMRNADTLVYLSSLSRISLQDSLYRLPLAEAALPMQRAHMGRKGSGIEEDYAGVPVVASWNYLPSLSWGMVVKIDVDEAFEPAQTARTLTLFVFLGLLLLSTLFGLLLHRWGTQKERDLEARTRQLEEAQRIGRLGSWTFDPATRMFTGSSQTKALFGLSDQRDEYALEEMASRFHAEDASRWRQFARLICGEVDVLDETLRLATSNGDQPRYVRIRGEVQRDERGRMAALSGTVQDVTQSKTSEMALRALNEHLQNARDEAHRLADEADAANKAKSEFLANVSHEIRTPLNGILGITQLLLDTQFPPDQRHYVEIVDNSGNVLLSLINNLLDVSKIEAGKMEIDETDFQISRLLEEVVASLSRTSPSPYVNFFYSVDEGVPDWIVSDPVRVRQVMVNLIGNALKFTEKGDVEVSLTSRPLVNSEHELCLEVRDTGIGIPAQKLPLLFGKFTQADTSTTRKYGGTGLGLAISKKLMDLLGGSITVESTEGVGSVFRARWKAKSSVMESVHPEPFSPPPRIWVYCSHPRIENLIAQNLRRWNAEPVAWSDSNKLAETPKPDALIVWQDAQSPAAHELARLSQLDVPTLVFRDSTSTEPLNNTHVHVLTKPLQWGVLLSKLRSVLASSTVLSTAFTVTESPRTVDPHLNILLVEDHPVNRQVAGALLTRLGHRVTMATNGEEALNLLKTHTFDVIVMDVQMPVMDGLQATIAIRSGQTLQPDIPIIACTAHAMQADRERCIAVGMNDYITKPLNVQSVQSALARWQKFREQDAQDRYTEVAPPKTGEVFNLEEVRQRLEEVSLIAEIFEAFRVESPALLHALKEAHEADDIEKVRRELHTLKGLAATVGGSRLAQRAEFWEKHETLTHLQHRVSMLAELTQELHALCEALQQTILH